MPEGLFSIAVFTDALEEIHRWHEEVQAFPEAIDKAVGANAALALKETIVKIDELIYATPEPENYHRTKNLRRANQIKKLGTMAWLLYNDAAYAGYVHDGTSVLQGRPWMQNAVDAVQDQMDENLVKAGMAALEGGAATHVPEGLSSTAIGQGSEGEE